jgi:hypothetical protein
VLGDFFEIAGECLDELIDIGALVVAECGDRW